MKSGRATVFASVAFSRTVYSVSWFVVAAVFPAMEAQYHYPIQALGYFTSVFLVAAGVFQIPVGIYAARVGPRTPALFGLALLAATSGASVITGEFYFQLVLRFLGGVGAALFFSPGLVLASEAMKERSGLATGAYAGLYYLGGGLATLIFPSVASEFGWRIPFVITTVVTLIALVENYLALKSVRDERRTVSLRGALNVVWNRSVLAVAIGIVGSGAVSYILTEFLVTYVQVHLGYSAAFSGAISSLVFIGAVLGGPIGGYISDTVRRRRLLIVIPAVGGALTVSLLLLSQPVSLVVGTFVTGFLISAVFGNAYAYATQLGIDRNNLAMAMGVINVSGLLFGSVSAPVFALIVSSYGYGIGWLAVVAVGLASAPLVYLAREPGR